MKTKKQFQNLVICSLLLIAILISNSAFAQIAVTTDGSAPDASAMLDVISTDKGFLPPRMTTLEISTIPNPAEGLSVYNTTTHKPVYYNGAHWMDYDGTEMLKIGDFWQGGVIFYLDPNGGGLVCALSDHSSLAEWGCAETAISGADGIVMGTGAQNTIDIEAGCATAGTAADICANLSLNGYTDWFLPSKNELKAMWDNRGFIDATAFLNGGADFEPYGGYWSSSEAQYFEFAIGLVFNTGISYENIKSATLYVRAVRAF